MGLSLKRVSSPGRSSAVAGRTVLFLAPLTAVVVRLVREMTFKKASSRRSQFANAMFPLSGATKVQVTESHCHADTIDRRRLSPPGMATSSSTFNPAEFPWIFPQGADGASHLFVLEKKKTNQVFLALVIGHPTGTEQERKRFTHTWLMKLYIHSFEYGGI